MRDPNTSALPADARLVFLDGPTHTAARRASLTFLAARLRRLGFGVVEPRDVLRRAHTRDVMSGAYARAAADLLADADAVVLAPGWESDVGACATFEIADVMELPVTEWRCRPA